MHSMWDFGGFRAVVVVLSQYMRAKVVRMPDLRFADVEVLVASNLTSRQSI
jgi:hypothetical protein